MALRIGIDFDNTIADYDRLFSRLAWEANVGLVAPDGNVVDESRMALRRRLRGSGPTGETAWRDLQALAYGPRMDGAFVFEGVRAFLATARAAGAETYVVSHKTRYALQDSERCHDLRASAMAWLDAQGLIGDDGFDRERIFFHETREEKIARILELDCDHFIDDLEEVFNEPAFPAHTTGHLLVADGRQPHLRTHGCHVCVHPTWGAIHATIFSA
jgi:hypothetical protein